MNLYEHEFTKVQGSVFAKISNEQTLHERVREHTLFANSAELPPWLANERSRTHEQFANTSHPLFTPPTPPEIAQKDACWRVLP